MSNMSESGGGGGQGGGSEGDKRKVERGLAIERSPRLLVVYICDEMICLFSLVQKSELISATVYLISIEPNKCDDGGAEKDKSLPGLISAH